jgi:hypothetical protein
LKQALRYHIALLLALLAGNAALPQRLSAAPLEIPLALDYRIVEQALGEQLFSGPGGTAEVYADRLRCNVLLLSEPRVEGAGDGRLRVSASLRARTGTPLFGRCWLSKSWRVLLETVQTAQVSPGSSIVSFRVEDSAVLSPDDRQEVLPGFVQGWIRDHVHPRLAAVTVDLQPAVSGLQELLDAVMRDARFASADGATGLLSPLQLTGVRTGVESLTAVLSIEVADAPADWTEPAQAPLTEDELASWDAAWQSWDGFATWAIKTLAFESGSALNEALADTLLETRYELRDALARDERDRDPVRELFLNTWQRLAPLLQDIQTDLPASQALGYAAFVSAGDAIHSLDLLAPHLGLRLNRDSLRSMARILMPAVSDYDLRYDTAVDPELRVLLGLDPDFDEEPADSAAAALLDWLIGSAHAAQIRPELLKQLDGWVPRRPEIDDYLHTVGRLLDAVADAERDRGKVPAQYHDLYDALLRATAWQESCWRQYIEREGEIETIRSPAGSVGLMQVNTHVWRGIYDLDALLGNIAYNARAGSEILVHYLVDHAVRKLGPDLADDPDSLARAAYAAYNGGPRHLTRFRDPRTSASLRNIDKAFWQKYRAIQSEGPLAVKHCLAG